jgi:glyceraldehyde 3-phosphate dehydrogenase
MLKIAINGFGRIGRLALRSGWDNKKIKFVAVNDLGDVDTLAHLLKYDTVFGEWNKDVSVSGGDLLIDGKKIEMSSEREPSNLPWKKFGVDIVIESTGFFTSLEDARNHLAAGAGAVVISAPSKNAPTYLMGINHDKLSKKDKVICNASCTTNSTGAVAVVMEENFGVQKAMLSTIHSVTAGQNVVDGVPSERKPDLRRARTILGNIIPTSTGAAQATALAVTSLKDKFDGVAIRVPSPNVSLSDIVFLTKKNTTVEEVNDVFKKASKSSKWKGVLSVTDKPLVSSDFIGNPHASIVDLGMTRVVDGNLVKVMAWYDNEFGYVSQLLTMVEEVGNRVL